MYESMNGNSMRKQSNHPNYPWWFTGTYFVLAVLFIIPAVVYRTFLLGYKLVTGRDFGIRKFKIPKTTKVVKIDKISKIYGGMNIMYPSNTIIRISKPNVVETVSGEFVPNDVSESVISLDNK